jgi:general stress protein YciG
MTNTKQQQQQQSSGKQGFASMDAEQQRRIASEGGKAAHASGHAHEFSHDEAVEAGRKGGQSRE